MRRLLLVLGCLTACRAHVDPLSIDRQRLDALARAPIETGWQPEAILAVHESTLDTILAKAMEVLRQQDLRTTIVGPLGVDALITPRLGPPPEVQLNAAEGCDSCVQIDLSWHGTVDVQIGSGAMAMHTGVRWSTRATGQLDLVVTPLDTGEREVQIRYDPARPLDIELDLENLPQPWNYIASSALVSKVMTPLAEDLLAEPIPLLTLTHEVRDVRLRVDQGLIIELLFNVLDSSLAPVPELDSGWALSIPAGTLKGLARAHSLREQGDYLIDPTSVSLFGDRFAIELKLWKVGRRYTWREYRIQGGIRLEDDAIRFAQDEVVETQTRGWGANPLGSVVRGFVLRTLADSTDVSLPTRASADYAGQRLTLTLDDVHADRNLLIVRGNLE